MPSLIVKALLFALPFLVLPIGVSVEVGKVIIAEILVVLLAGFLVVTYPTKKLITKDIPSLTIVLVFLLSILNLFLNNSEFTFFGNQFRLQGTFFLWILLVFSYFSKFVTFNKNAVWVTTSLLALHFLLAISLNTTIDGRAVGTLGEPNALAAIAIFLLPFLWQSQKERPLSALLQIVGLLLCILIIYISGSRSGMIAFVIQVVFLFFAFGKFISLKKSVIICLFLFATSLSLPFFQKENLYENRNEIWHAALLAGYKHPITGWGFGNTEIALKEYNQKLYNRVRGYYVDSSHNIFLDLWVQGGFIGLSSFVVLIYYAFRMSLKQKDVFKICLLFGLLTVLSFNPVSAVTLIQFWWLLGQSSEDMVN